MSVIVRPQRDGGVIVARRIPGGDGAPTAVLRLSGAEWADFVEGVRGGGFDSTLSTASLVSRDVMPSPLLRGAPGSPAAGQPEAKAGHACTTSTTNPNPDRGAP